METTTIVPKPAKKSNHSVLRRLFLLVVIAVMGVAVWHIKMGSTRPIAIEHVGDIPVYEDFLPKGSLGRPGTKRRILYVVIHETDNFAPSADAAAHNSFIHQNCLKEKLSWHYTVDDHQIYHHLPDNENAYHASDLMRSGGGNLNGIGIELCVNEGGDYEQTLENGIQLTARLLNAYHLSIEDVKKHQDFCGKKCPARLIEQDRWGEFLDRVTVAQKNP